MSAPAVQQESVDIHPRKHARSQFALLAPAPLRAVLLDAVPGRRQRQPVQVRVHRARRPTSCRRGAARPAIAGLVIGALFILPFLLFSATSRPARRQVRQVAADALREDARDRDHGARGRRLRHRTTRACCSRCVLPDGRALDAVRPGQVRLPAAAPERATSSPAATAWSRWAPSSRSCSARSPAALLVAIPAVRRRLRRGRVRRDGAARAGGGAGDPGVAGDRPDAAHQLEPVHARPGATCSSRAATCVGLPLAARHLVVVVLRRDLPRAVSRLRASRCCGGDEHVVTLLLAVFSVGIGIGSLLCERLSRRQVEIGLVPLGSIGMSVFAIDLYFASRGMHAARPAAGVGAFLARRAHWRVIADLVLLGALRRPLQRAALRADPGALAAQRTAPASSPRTTS